MLLEHSLSMMPFSSVIKKETFPSRLLLEPLLLKYSFNMVPFSQHDVHTLKLRRRYSIYLIVFVR